MPFTPCPKAELTLAFLIRSKIADLGDPGLKLTPLSRRDAVGEDGALPKGWRRIDDCTVTAEYLPRLLCPFVTP